MSTTREHCLAVLAILQDYAPTGKEQVEMATFLNDLVNDQRGYTHTVLRDLTWTLSDGLTHGDWPWTTRREG